MLLLLQALVLPEKFQHILRVMNTNIDGRRKVPYAMTAIKVTTVLVCVLPLAYAAT